MSAYQRSLGLPRMSKVVKNIIIANVAIWAIFSIWLNYGSPASGARLYRELTLDPRQFFSGFKIWGVFTYAWLHDLGGLGHLAMNSLGLYFLGPMLERRWGGRTFFKFYILTALIAGFFSVLVALFLPNVFGNPIVGASGALFGVLAAYSILFPEAKMLLFFIIPVKAKSIIWIAIAADFFFFFTLPHYGVAIQTHLGGAIGAWLLITGTWRPRVLKARLKRLRNRGQGTTPMRRIK